MRERESIARRALASLAAIGLLALPATGGAERAGDDAGRLASLKAAERSLTLELYSLDSRLERARWELSALQARRAQLERERAWGLARLRAARRTLASARARLAKQVRTLYLADNPDPLAVLLGAGSIDEALDGLDSLDRTAEATASVAQMARQARAQVSEVLRSLEERRRALQVVAEAKAATAADLASARTERAAYLERIRAERRATEQELRRAQAVAARAAAAQPPPGVAAPTSAAVTTGDPRSGEEAVQARLPVHGRRVLTVVATAYALAGTTATGIPVGPGVVAVDPAVIPLGAKLSIPGYGEGVAADTGPAIRGLRIDVWVPTDRQARLWGWRTVTIVVEA